jgi:hypothetical protein
MPRSQLRYHRASQAKGSPELVLDEDMQQPQGIGYADITEVRTVTGAATCNQLLAAGWVLLGVYPLTTVAEMTQGGEQQKQDTQRYVRRFVGYVVGKKRE